MGVRATERGSAAIEFASAEARTRGSRLHAVHAWRPPTYVRPPQTCGPTLRSARNVRLE